MLERSEASKFAKSVFFEQFNDIDVYVEDTAYGYEKMYVEILSRIFHREYNIKNVFPVGPRLAVLARCGELQNEATRPALFIVDGDLYLLSGEELPQLRGLYRLPMYCIENVLVDVNAIHSFLNEEDPVRLDWELKREFAFEEWVAKNSALLLDLFVEYGVSFVLNKPEQTVRFSVNHLVSASNGNLDPEKVGQRIGAMRQCTLAVAGEERYIAFKDEVLRSVKEKGSDVLSLISGKDYLFPLLKARIRNLVRTKAPDLNIKLRLAMKCDLSKIANMRDHVMKSAEIPAV